MTRTLAVVPARGGSKGLPGKNVRPLVGRPLIEHSLLLAGLCPEVDRTVVSTDAQEIAEVARSAGGEVVERPDEIARDETPMLPVLQHVLATVDPEHDFDLLLLLDPTSPGRLPEDVTRAHELLARDPAADGVVSVSEPFNLIWESVVERDGYMQSLFPEAVHYGGRQEVPRAYRINAVLYLFRTAFLRGARESWLEGRHLVLEVPEARSFHIDTEADFRLAELAVESGLVEFPWLERVRAG